MVKKDDEVSVSSETKGPLKSFQALMGEGEKFSRDKLYIKAIQSYTEALDLLPQDDDKSTAKDINDRLNGLVARSACYLKIGKNNLALQDAEESLKSNKEFTRGLYQKAEALYAMGEFELALMFYHRGKKLRSDLREFQLGINKAQEAIDNSVGDPNRVKLEASGDLSIFYKNDEVNFSIRHDHIFAHLHDISQDETKKKKKQPIGYVRASQKKDTTVQRKPHPPPANPRTTKQLLGDLYEDRVFLDKIINNTTVTKPNTRSGDAIYQLASDGIDYLDGRTHFWRQQEPLYARKSLKKADNNDETYKYVHRELEAIDELQNMDQFVDARRRAQRLLEFCERLDERKFPEKQPVIADVYSRLGNAYLELGDYNKALDYHFRDLTYAESKHDTDRSSRALDNLGRVYARSGQFAQAIQVWERKIPLASSPLEKAWLFHEIGQCHFGLGDYERAKRYGERSYVEAVAANDPIWQLNAKVLVAHSETKLRQYRDAEKTFEEALELARDQHDMAAERAIERALKDVRDQIAKGAADSPPDRAETMYDIKVNSDEPIEYADDKEGLIKLTIFGDNGSSGSIDLRGNENDPKKYDGYTTTLKKKAYDAGKLTKLALTCTKIGSWPLDSIEISDSKRKTKQKFLLADSIESTTTVIDLFPEGSIVEFPFDTRKNKKKGKPKPVQSDRQPSAARQADSPKPVQYTVTTKTGSALGSGTDANVFITLNGDKNKIDRHRLGTPESNRNPFEKGSKDDFKFEDTDIGKLKTIVIEHDNSGMASGWFLDSVEVKYNGNTYKFPVGRWLDSDEGDKRISLELEPNKKPASKIASELEDNQEESRSSISPPNETKARPSSTEKVDYDDFFDDDKDDDDSHAPNAVDYEVTVKTGDKRGAGTDANVYLSMFGDKTNSERHELKETTDRTINRFEKGATNRFKIQGADVGKIKTIRIEHDGTGIGAGWYLDSIEIHHVPRNETYMFPVDRWLDTGEGDKRISLDLEPDKKPGQAKDSKTPDPKASETSSTTDTSKKTAKPDDQSTSKKPTQYLVTVKTGSPMGSGTDANVFITLNGDKQRIVRRPLEKPDSGRNPFERNSKDDFKFEDTDVGQLKTIVLEHDNTGLASGWYCDFVEVKYNGNTVKFPVGRWLDSDEGDKRISLELEPNKKPSANTTTDDSHAPDAVDYEVTVKTAKKKGAGTDANVYLGMYGDKTKTERHQLKESIEKSRNLFESGATNRFKIHAADVGKIKSIRIEHDGTGIGAGWYPESIEIRHIPHNETYFFLIDRWLDSGEGDKRISIDVDASQKPGQSSDSKSPDPAPTKKEATPAKSEPAPTKTEPAPAKSEPAPKATTTTQAPSDPNKKTKYTVTTKTGSALGAGTDANVYITLNGDKNKVVRQSLEKPEDGWNPFERNGKDDFVFNEVDIGQLKTIIIEHDGTGSGAGWFCDFVEVKYNGNTIKFPVGRWLDVDEGDKRISLELEPNKKPPAKIITDTSKAGNNVEYEVTVKTAKKSGAGTDANVYLGIFGEQGKVERQQLKEPMDKSRNLFESGATNRFKINAPDVGKITTIRLEHDGTGLGAGWYVDSVEVRHVSHNETYKFPIDRWLDAGEGDKRISLDLEPNKKPGQLKCKN
ncbi:unnamed protein product [Adineta ricciae]|uniref:PLAT domain-containing protein n=1 Tax=Adineta ricciae TaxID=249248 RepID=A0A814QT58_ADIRI|nr:unnamed protein product [Adineta ricciae]